MQQIVHARYLRQAAWLAAMMGVLTSGKAVAGEASAGCDAANRGGMNSTVASGGAASRRATFEQGEALTLSISTQGTRQSPCPLRAERPAPSIRADPPPCSS